MTDRELLEAAAKAAGLGDAKWQDMAGWGDVRHDFSSAIFSDRVHNETGSGYWNPLIDDGDALRLAVKLFMQVDIIMTRVRVAAFRGEAVRGETAYELINGDSCAATRRAIVRAAASLVEGKGEAG